MGRMGVDLGFGIGDGVLAGYESFFEESGTCQAWRS